MKWKWKGRISLWLACILVLTALPASVNADSANADVRLYTGTKKVKPYDYVSDDTGAYGQDISGNCPSGCKRDGWQMWTLDEYGYTVANKWIEDNEAAWPSYMVGPFASGNIVLVPNWVPQYSANPITAENPTVVIGDGTVQDSVGFYYQWLHEYKVVDANSYQENDGQLKALNTVNISYAGDSRWASMGGQSAVSLDLPLQRGDVVTIKNVTGGTDVRSGFSAYLKDADSNYLESYDRNKDVYYATAKSDGVCTLCMQNNLNAGSVQADITVSRYEPEEEAQVGTKTYNGGSGKYCCKVSYLNNGQQISFYTNSVEIPEYDLAKAQNIENGTCTFKINDQEVTAAAPRQTVTVETNPVEGYKTGSIAFRKTGEAGGEPVEIVLDENGSGSFVMPDYDVTVEAVFLEISEEPVEPKEYAVTKGNMENGSCEFRVNGQEVTKAKPDETVTVKAVPEEGYQVDSAAYRRSDGSGEPVKIWLGADGNGSFVMPDYDVTVEITFKEESSEIVKPQPPEIKITLDGTNNTWSSFCGDVAFNLIYKKEKNLKIEVKGTEESAGKNVVWYYLAEKNLFWGDRAYSPQEIESVIAGRWQEGADSVKLTSDGRYVLYVKVSDEAGNTVYANTQGIVIDKTAPVISGVKDGREYYGVTTFAVKDTYLDTVTVDGKKVKPGNGVYSIQPDNTSHKIIATDKAGNKISCKISVYETWVRDGIQKTGVYALEKGTAYKLGKGKWKIVGDDTVYQGGTIIYVPNTGDYDFRKQ